MQKRQRPLEMARNKETVLDQDVAYMSAQSASGSRGVSPKELKFIEHTELHIV